MEYNSSSGQSGEGIIIENDYVSVCSGGTANSATVNFGGSMLVFSGGTANSTTVNSRGLLYVSDGGTANSTIVNRNGRLIISNGGTANNTTVNSSGRVDVQTDASANCTTLYALGYLHVSFGGTANSTIVNRNGRLIISNGGTANDTTLIYNGSLTVSSSGTANNTKVNADGHFTVCSEGIANSTTVVSGGYLTVCSEGIANGARIDSGGHLTVDSGGTATDFTAEAGVVLSFAIAPGTFIQGSYHGSALEVKDAYLSAFTVNSGGKITVCSGGTADSTMIDSGGSLLVSGGIATSTTIDSRGYLTVDSGGTAAGATVVSGGSLTVSSGGTATDVIWTPCEGYVNVFEGGAVTFVSQYSGVYYGSNLHQLSNAAVMDAMTLRAQEGMNVMSGGTAQNTLISGGHLTVSGGGTAKNTVISSGNLTVSGSGTAISTTVVSGGYLIVSGGGTAQNTVVSGGNLTVSGGGTAGDTTVTSRSSMYVGDGGTHTGRLRILQGAYVTFWSGSILDFDLTHTSTGRLSLVNDFSLLNGSPLYTVTVSSDQAAGIYSLADNAEAFYRTITVRNTDGESLGTLALGETVEIAGKAYSLSMICGDLQLAVGCEPQQITVVRKTVLADETGSVNSGEAYYDTTVSAGGKLIVSSGGTATLFTISSGGTIEVSGGGTAKRGSISRGELIVHSTANVYSATIFYSGNLSVSGGHADNTVVSGFGSMYVSSGGIADYTVVSSSGRLHVLSGGLIENTKVYYWGSALVSSGGTANSTTVYVYGLLGIEDGGYARDTILSSGGWVTAGSGGVAERTVVVSSGEFTVASDGLAYETVVSSAGRIKVCSGGSATGLTLCSGASYSFEIASGTFIAGAYAGSAFEMTNGQVSDYTVHSGGTMNICSEGMAANTVVSSGGCIRVSYGGTATDLAMCDGASYVFDIASNTFIAGTNAGAAFEIANGLVSGCTVKSGDTLGLHFGCKAYDTVVAGGSFTVVRDTLVNGVTVDRGGSMTMNAGGLANEVVVSSGHLGITNGTANSVTVSAGSLNADLGAVVNSVVVFTDGKVHINNATINSTVVSSGGQLLVTDRGTANDVTVSAGGQLIVSNNANANSITVLSGSFAVNSGASASGTVISSGGQVMVASGGTADSTTVNADCRLILESGGTADTVTVGSGGVMKIGSGGKVSSATIQSGGKLTGFFDCSDIALDSGVTLYFDISGIGPDNTDALVRIAGLSELENNPFSLLVSDSQEAGVYRLAEGAQGFDRTISVVNSVTEFGSLSLDRTVQVNGRDYTLSLNDGDLMLNVSAPTAQYVYLDFDGEENVRYTNSDLEMSFDLSVADPLFLDEQRLTIVSALSETYKKDNIVFTLERPEGVDYSTLYFGVSPAFGAYGSFFGVAETHDANNRNRNDNAFVLLDNSYSTGQIISTASNLLDHLLGFSCFAYGSLGLGKYAENRILLSLSSGWEQLDPYNKYCPIDPRTGNRSMTGCTNTAASQIIYYWMEKGMLNLSLSLEDQDAFVSNKYITVDPSDSHATGHLPFAAVNELLKDFEMENDDCIAALCFAAGVVQQANYASTETTTAWNTNLFVRAGFEDTASYKTMYLVKWPAMTESYLDVDTRLSDDDFIVRDLLEGRPVGITIRSLSHAIVLDGYDSSRNMYHLNFGWGADNSNTRWYTIEELNELQIDQAVYGIEPVVFPDLTVKNLSAGDEVVNLNEDVTLSFSVFNGGTEVSSETFAYVYCGDVLLENCRVGYVSPGYSRELSCTVNASSLPIGENVLTVKMYSQKDEDSLSCASATILHRDDPAPRTPSVSADITEPTNTDVLVSAEFSRIAVTKEYSFDGETWSAYSGPVRMTENGTAFFRCADEAGIISEIARYDVTIIDRTAPEKPVVTASVTEPTNRSVTLTAEFDGDSFVREYSFNGQDWIAYTDAILCAKNETVFFRGIDEAGNISTVVCYAVTNIDTTSPTAPAGLDFIVSDRKVALLWSVSTDDFSGVREYVVNYSHDGGETITVRTSGTNYVLNDAELGDYSWSVQAVDFAGNESAVAAGEAFTVSGFKPYTVEYSADSFEHTIRFAVSSPALDVFRMPGGSYRLRALQESGGEWTEGDPIVAAEFDEAPQLVRSDADGNSDVFFANAVGTWESGYLAQHTGSVKDWAGTGEYVSLFGKNRLADIIEGSDDANILLMTDDANGDALFVDDIYTALPGSITEQQARIAQIDEIRAGAGNDIVDMTSQRFEYIGGGLTVRGGAGDDTIWANKGDNCLFGDAGNDRIVGASGNDVIVGGIGNDRMHGGGGSDVFTFCENWGADNVEQLAGGSVTLWFVKGNMNNWDAATLTYTDDKNSVKVSGVAAEIITLKFGDDGSGQFAALSGMGAFFDATTERIFEESGKGILASL